MILTCGFTDVEAVNNLAVILIKVLQGLLVHASLPHHQVLVQQQLTVFIVERFGLLQQEHILLADFCQPPSSPCSGTEATHFALRQTLWVAVMRRLLAVCCQPPSSSCSCTSATYCACSQALWVAVTRPPQFSDVSLPHHHVPVQQQLTVLVVKHFGLL